MKEAKLEVKTVLSVLAIEVPITKSRLEVLPGI